MSHARAGGSGRFQPDTDGTSAGPGPGTAPRAPSHCTPPMTLPNWSLTGRGYEFGGLPRWQIYGLKAVIGFVAAIVAALLEMAATGHTNVTHIAVLLLGGQAVVKATGYAVEGPDGGWVLDRYAPLDWCCDAALVTGFGMVPVVWLVTDGTHAVRWAIVALIVVALTYGWSRE